MQNLEFNTGVIKPIECVRDGWALIKDEYWLLFAITLVGLLIGGISLYVVLGAMVCGIIYCYLRKIDGRVFSFDDLWKGFEWFGSGFIVTVAFVVPLLVVFAFSFGPILAAAIMAPNLSEDELWTMMIGAFATDLVLTFFVVCFHTLLMFSFPLVVDRGLGAVRAMTTSARAVWHNMSGVVGLGFVNFGLVIVGYAALCFGIYFVIPVILATHVVAYRKVFPALK